MDELKKMLATKKKSKPSGKKGEGKMNALKGLRDMLSKMMGGDMDKAMKHKLMIAAKDKKGLKEGLEKAEEMIDNKE